MERPSVREFFSRKTVLMTGGTGFMGKVLIEKLLRCCPEIKLILIITRTKRGKAPYSRILEMAKLPLFEPLLKIQPNAMRKVKAIDGDLTKNDMGLTPKSRQELLDHVDVFFHLGASLRMEADLDEAVEVNLRGTLRALDLAQEMKNLKSFVHVSTVFCQCEPRVVEEKIFTTEVSPTSVITLSDWLKNNEHRREITSKILGAHPNCYTFTKQLAENIVGEKNNYLPVTIVRPSIVVPTFREPIPGWVDSLNGPIGILVAGGKGVLRSMMCGKDNQAQVIPCDIAINAIILAAWERANNGARGDVQVYNSSSGDFLPLTYGTILERGMEVLHKYPLNPGLWYPNGSMTKNKYVHKMNVFLFQLLPALLIDFLLFIVGQKPFLVRIQNKVKLGCQVLEYFTMRSWEVVIENCTSLQDRLSQEEREIFYLTNVNIDVGEMMKSAILGAKQYCMKEPLSTIPSARFKLKIFWLLDKILKMFLGYQFYKLLMLLHEKLSEIDVRLMC